MMQKSSVRSDSLLKRLGRCFCLRAYCLRAYCIFILMVGLTGIAHAGPWIETGDERLRHHIQLLADKNIIKVPITTWPLMWSDVIHDVRSADYAQLNEQALWSVQYVKYAFSQQTEGPLRLNTRIYAAS